MKYAEIEKMSEKELNDKLREIKLELLKVNTKKSSGAPPENPGQIRVLKKTIARIKTRRNQLKKKTQ